MEKESTSTALAEKIKEATPYSITVTDNPVFKTKIELRHLIKAGEHGGDDYITIPSGTPLRILDCDLDVSGLTMVRYNPSPTEEYNILIHNQYLEYVSGNLGVRVD